ncbi:MAG: hypothetical protein QQN63_10870 [Nitrosopumilus sp.]
MDANAVVKEMSQSDWLKGKDIEGKEVTVTIKEVEQKMQERDGKQIPQLVLHFEEDVKQLGLNMGNANIMIQMFGGDTDDWVSQKITLFTVMVNKPGSGDQVPGIRIKAPGTTETQEAPLEEAPEPEVDIDGVPPF